MQPTSIILYRAVVRAIFDECNKFDDHETGGALIGTYSGNRETGIVITVAGVIEAGPRARRTATSFFKDGEYQEARFRQIEAAYPEIEHLGNWHTHHMNGYPELSPGDCETYHKNVNSRNHNTDFWYAFLVTHRLQDVVGYAVKHYVLYRGDPDEYWIPGERITYVDRPILCRK